jgi:RND family efflux transporter MFP subunit
MKNATISRLIITAALLLPLGCDRAESDTKSALPPARAEGGASGPKVPIPASRPDQAQAPAAASNRYVATALPRDSVELGPRTSGTLTAVLVEEGARVKKGQLLFRVDSRGSRLGVAQAETALQGAGIHRDNALRELERQRKLAEAGTISAAVLERAEASYTTAANGAEQAEVALSMARRATGDSSVVSPIDGIVTRKLKSVGETATMTPPTVVLEIQDQSAIELRARVPEAALRTVRAGDRITAHFSALQLARGATVVRISPTVDAQTRTIEVVAEADNADGALRPGMYVEVELAPPPAAPAAETPNSTLASATRKPSKRAKEKL